jgi:hypothetical protein
MMYGGKMMPGRDTMPDMARTDETAMAGAMRKAMERPMPRKAKRSSRKSKR